MKTHLAVGGGKWGACWHANHPGWLLTNDVLAVTCKDCLGQPIYRERLGLSLIDARARVIHLEKRAGVR